MESSRELFAKMERCWAFHGRPSAHFPAIDRLEFAFSTTLSWMYTPYLFTKVVLVPFQAVMPPPQLRSASRDDWIHAVPNP